MREGSSDLLRELLKGVSRSFYLTLRVLPAAIRPQIGLAYLLARASDTIADTDAVPKPERLAVLTALRDRITGGKGDVELGRFAGQTAAAERVLLERLGEALGLLATFHPDDQERIRTALEVIISGQMLDVERFANASTRHIVALESDANLDDYTYRVAGVVGEFWTRMCRARLFPAAALDDGLLLRKGVRFGKGLQLVNILRDLPVDLQMGRCYLPRATLAKAGLVPFDLLALSAEPRLRPIYDQYLDLAEANLSAGWDYTNHLPRRAVRVRLACAWPILIGMQTIAQLRVNPVLDPTRRIKISRQQVRSVMVQTLFWYGWPQRWRRLLDMARR
jgi:farnesyl-diphosphate farnesyltransferase